MPKVFYPVNPDSTVPWNDLPPLPIRKELYQHIEILERLGDAKAALARLHGRSVVIPEQGLLINTISLQEAKNSSAIENIFTTDDELYKSLSDHSFDKNGAPGKVLRSREALWNGYSYLLKTRRFDHDYFIRAFQEIKQTKEGIRPDYMNTAIKKGGSGLIAGKVIYTPPLGHDIIQDKLDNLVSFLNDDDQFNIDHLLKMVTAHFQLMAIHPFRDGNGRSGRIFCIHYLNNKGLLNFPILLLSKYILEHKDDYYSGFIGVIQRGDWKKWFLFMLSAIENASDITYQKINDIVLASDKILERIKKDKRKFRETEDLIKVLFNQPFTKVKHLVDAGIYAENTARDYLNRLSEMQVLEKREIDGHHYYLNTELYRILAE